MCYLHALALPAYAVLAAPAAAVLNAELCVALRRLAAVRIVLALMVLAAFAAAVLNAEKLNRLRDEIALQVRRIEAGENKELLEVVKLFY